MSATTSVPDLSREIEIDAPPARVWALVSDVRRMSEWSPQVVRSFVRGGVVRRGTTFLNVNRRGLLFWPTRGRVVRFDPHREFAFQIAENWTIWSFTLEETGTGTRVVQRREAPRGISGVSRRLTQVALGGQEPFTVELLDGMAQTLERVKAEAEAR
ncbi:SRPBCC family protein [Nocardioides pantholopis]|uniref:SRPBCC family protein n=1 Tax=Nocardioides pantholopis TaxID=2483798 RepID=UPI000F0808EF|nr:SRPBCC family protein [Nocardioides pantholopis]